MPDAGDLGTEERLGRLREVLAGGLSGYSRGNVLIAAALRAADRLRTGEVLTDLESLLLNVVRTVLSDQELRNWGRIYRETLTAHGRPDMASADLTGRLVMSGYGMAALRAEARELSEEAVTCPNVSFLNTEALAEGAPLCSAEFAAGVRESGYGVVGFSGASRGDETASQAGSFRAKWEVQSYSRKALLTASTHQGPAPSSSQVLYDGPGSHRISFGIYGGTERYDDLIRELGTLTHACNAAVADLETGDRLAPGQVFLGVAWGVLKLFVFLKAQMGGHDDEPPCVTLGFTFNSADTAVLFHRREVELDLKGGGTGSALRLRYSGERPSFSSGHLEYATYRADGHVSRQPSPWSAPIPLGWQSVTAPTLASYRSSLYAVFASPGDQLLMWSRLDGGTWSTPARIGSSGSSQRAALTVHGDRLYSFHTTPDGDILWSCFNGSSWTREVRVDGWDSPVSPAVASHDGNLWVSHRDHSKRIHVDRFGEDHHSEFSHRFDGSVSDSAPALVSTGAALWVAHRGLDDKVHVRYSGSSPSSAGWQTHDPAHTLLTHRSPTLVDHPGLGLHLLARGLDGKLRLGVRTDHGGWGGIDAPAHNGAFPALDAGGAAFHNGKLYVMYRR